MDSRRHVVLYDDACPLCRSQVRLLCRLDWFDRLRFVPLSASAGVAHAAGLTTDVMLEAMHLVAVDGTVLRGARAFRFAALRLPLLAPLALGLWIPGALWVAERVYAWISRNRYRLNGKRDCGEACSSGPPTASARGEIR